MKSRLDFSVKKIYTCRSFCLPKATAPLVIIIHSRPLFWSSATCSTMDASRPRASPWPSSRVITALPSLITILYNTYKIEECLLLRIKAKQKLPLHFSIGFCTRKNSWPSHWPRQLPKSRGGPLGDVWLESSRFLQTSSSNNFLTIHSLYMEK